MFALGALGPAAPFTPVRTLEVMGNDTAASGRVLTGSDRGGTVRRRLPTELPAALAGRLSRTNARSIDTKTGKRNHRRTAPDPGEQLIRATFTAWIAAGVLTPSCN
jgi:hypothetical protein